MTGFEASHALCLGEAMAVLRAEAPEGLGPSGLLRCSVGGAEANVAGALAALGVRTTWLSRLGRDPFGDFLAEDLSSRGVHVLAERDGERPTGMYFKESDPPGSRMHYYRSGSAATALNASALAEPPARDLLAGCEIVHTSGITAGILPENSGLLAHLLELRDRHRFLLSVDLNWRPALWRGREPHQLWELLRAADVLLLGADEAETVLGTREPDGIRERLDSRARIVVKSDAHLATGTAPDGTATTVPALDVDVVEPVGAGDGFAAGYLAGLLRGYDETRRLRLGHLIAAGVLAEPGDHVTKPPEPALRQALLDADVSTWKSTRVTSAGITSPILPTVGGQR